MDAFVFLLLPLLITTVLLAAQARWAWSRTRDKVLRGMQLEEVQKRLEQGKKHRNFAKGHAITVGTLLMFGLILSVLLPYSDWTEVPGFLWAWIYVLLIPHLLGLYLYHVRWNAMSLDRKRKLDEEDTMYEGDFSLKSDVRYGVNDEGELIELAALEAEERQEKRA